MGWKPPGASMRVGACLLLGLAGGCVDKIALGTECPPFGVECLERTPRVRGADGAPGDSGQGPTPTADGGREKPPFTDADGQVVLPIDDGSVGGAPVFPAIENGSLDITGGSANGGVLSSFTVQARPWTSCNPPTIGPGAYPRADLRANFPIGAPDPSEQLEPSDGSSLVNVSPDGTTLAQTLGEPMRKGVRYAFKVDLASTLDATDLSLEVQGSTSTCFAPQALASAGPATPGAWTSFCVSFTPTQDYSAIVLSASSPQPSTGTRLFIDNIREDPSCD